MASWWSWEDDRQRATSFLRKTGGKKWFDITRPAEPGTVELEVRQLYRGAGSQRMGTVTILMLDAEPVSMSLALAEGYTP